MIEVQQKLVGSPEENQMNIYERTRYKLVLRMCLLFTILVSIVSVLNYSNKKYSAVPDFFVVGMCIICYIILRKTKRYRLVGRIAAFSSLIIINVALFKLEAIHYTTPLWMIVNILFTFIVLQKVCGFISLIVNFASLFIYLLYFFPSKMNAIPVFTTSDSILYISEFAVIAVALGYMLYVFLNAIQKTEQHMLLVNDTLNDQNFLITRQKAEMEVMLKEIHHRVKNNLQIISSLLRLQADTVKAGDRSAYHEAVNRVSAMAIIHEKMYQAPSLTEFDLKQYVESLIASLFESYVVELNVKTSVHVTVKSLSTKSIVPVAMLLNELISNSIKHAFRSQQNPRIEIFIANLDDDIFMIEYNDNGVWVKNSSESFGMEIIEAMTQQLDGSQTRRCTDTGTYYIFQLKNIV